MFKQFFLALGLAVTGVTAVGGAAFAQSSDASTMSAEQLEELFNKQKTRGLVLAPTNAQDNTGADDTAAARTAAQETYVELAPEDQVSIQISFDFDSSALRADQKPKLATLCQVMQSADIGAFRIVGHTDSSGSASYNERLSLLRAQEVKRHLETDCGIEPARLEAVGVGEAFLLDKADPAADANRRVEFQALS
ncbi:OmpA family protein [Pseudosulfitobacter koreensis]|uniref:OmpA family protein n=1 Tax=Pseudosulfitobacter koreensis TaxID=2968472 RepID=A0ABT1Z2K5_9RHOB|nr:OmpA family protein [Pseudosulfitobacter koreense]MCR8827371.1 OmpA family protein [Pseudosulfitobacter koreense]